MNEEHNYVSISNYQKNNWRQANGYKIETIKLASSMTSQNLNCNGISLDNDAIRVQNDTTDEELSNQSSLPNLPKRSTRSDLGKTRGRPKKAESDESDSKNGNNQAKNNREWHNILERNRRQNLSLQINQLYKMIPSKKKDRIRVGKTMIVKSACQYITDLENYNKDLILNLKKADETLFNCEAALTTLKNIKLENITLKRLVSIKSKTHKPLNTNYLLNYHLKKSHRCRSI
ncbi:hypothetical protein A3Q56_05236 [Intoshia linei]|uniref:BHLH domain-containing protein n=1 Tax=Intoshia linei TaxID=1819745 RepID=A0A177B095_9BILA|nr:hypothetical protein A3Q56_05236 [Intoshia linei]